MGLLDTLADRLDVFISDLRLWCTLPAFGIMLEMDNHLYPISEWNRGAGLSVWKAMRFF